MLFPWLLSVEEVVELSLLLDCTWWSEWSAWQKEREWMSEWVGEREREREGEGECVCEKERERKIKRERVIIINNYIEKNVIIQYIDT